MAIPSTATQRAAKTKRGTVNPQPLHVAQIPDALLTLKTMAAIGGLSISTLYRKAANDPTFPALIRMGKRCTRCRAGSFIQWLAAQQPQPL